MYEIKVYNMVSNEGHALEVKVLPFEQYEVRVAWDQADEKYLFSIVDVVGLLTEQPNAERASTYWRKLKQRLKVEGNETVTNCHGLKMLAVDGKNRLTDVADIEQLLRIVQSIPSKKAEPIKQWLAQVGSQRLRQMEDPELNIEQMVGDYQQKGYSAPWINQRIRSIEVRNEMTDEMKRAGVVEKRDFAIITDIITKAWSGLTTKEYKQLKGLRAESLRDNMTNIELALNTLAEATTTEISKKENPKNIPQAMNVAQRGGNVAAAAREAAEKELGQSVVSSDKAIDYVKPNSELPFAPDKENNGKY